MNFESEFVFEFQLYGVIYQLIVMQLIKNWRFDNDYYRAKDLNVFQRNIYLITILDGIESYEQCVINIFLY